MKKNKIFLIVMAFCVMLSIGISVFAVAYAAADDGKTVQLVTLDYIENSLMKQIEEKIRTGSVESMKESIGQINQMLDYLNTQTAANAGGLQSVQTDLSDLRALLQTLDGKVTTLEQKAEQTALREQLDALIVRLETLEGTYSILTEDVASLKDSVGGVLNKVTVLEGTVTELKTNCESSISQLFGKISANEESISALESSAAAMKSSMETAKGEIAELNASYSVMLSRITTLEEEASTDRAALAEMKFALETIKTKINDMSGDYGAIVDAYNEYTKTIAALRAASDGGAASFSAIFLKQGEMLSCAGLSGDTMEIIVRRGDVVVHSPIATQGLIDLTDSVELLNGKKVPEYHYVMLVGGSDGRGIVSQNGDAWILVRGEYEIG